jgi:hypothetical protein
MGIDFSDLIPAKPQASGAATGGTATDGISFEDLIPKQSAAAPSAVEAFSPWSAAVDTLPAPAAGDTLTNAAMEGVAGATSPALSRIGGAAVKGAVEGFGHPIGQTILSPEAQDWMDAKQRAGGVGGFLAGVGSTAAEDIGTVGGVLTGIPNAVFRGVQGAVAQTGAEAGAPQLGRDIAAIPEAFIGSPEVFSHPITAREVQARDGVGIMEAWNRAHTENTARPAATPAATIADIGKAQDIDGAIAAAGAAVSVPVERPAAANAAAAAEVPPQPTSARITAAQVQARDGVGGVEAQRRAAAENAAAEPEVVNGWRRMQPGEPLMPGQEVATDTEGQQYVRERPAQAEVAEGPVEEEPDVLAAPAPQPAGAEATSEPIPPKTRGQALRDLHSDVKQSAEDRAQPFTDPVTGVVGLQDHEAYAPGVPGRLLADRELTPRNAGDHKLFYGTDPVYRASAEAIDRERNMAMVDLLARDVQDDVALEKAHDFRNAANPNQMGVFADEQAVPDHAQALVDKIDRMLDSPAGKEPGVQRVLNQIRTALHDRQGNIETLPSQIYGARRVLTTLLQKGVRGTTELADDVRSARHELTSLIEPDDGIGFNETITTGAPRFREFLSEWANRSLPINQFEYLQSRNHTNLDGYLELRKVQATLDDILKQRRATGNQKAKTLTEQQIENLVTVRNELAARNLRDRMAKMPGSDTTQQMSNAAKWGEGTLGKGIKFAAESGAHMLAAHTTGGVGNAALLGARYLYDKRAEKVARAAEAAQAAKIAARKRELLGQGAALPALPLIP